MPRLLRFRGKDIPRLRHGDGEADQGRGDIQPLKGAAHAVLAADGPDAQIHLGPKGAQEGRQGLAPAAGIPAGLREIFLEGEIHILKGGAGSDQLRHRFHHRQIGPVVGALFHDEGIIAPGHEGAVVRMLRFHTDLLDHGLDRGQLVLSAEGHQHRAGADGGIKALREPPAGAEIQIRGQSLQGLPEAGGGIQGWEHAREGFRPGGGDIDMLRGAVRIQKFPADIHDRPPVPVHPQAGLLPHHRYRAGLQVFLRRQGQEGLRVLRGHDHRHTLLAFGNGQLRAVQALIFFRHGVQVDFQPVRQLADGHADAAGAEVVAALNHTGRLSVSEKPLQLPLLRRVSLLDLRAAGFHAMGVMRLAGAGRSPDTVPAGAAAQENDHIPRGGPLPAHVFLRGGGDDRADFHPLRRVAGMIKLIHDARRQANLIAIGGITRRGRGDQLPLRQLAGEGLAHRNRRIRRARHPHGAIDIRPAAQGIPDRAADTGRRAAKGFNLRRMIMGFIFKQQEPGLLLSVRLHFDLHRAGVDFLALVQLREFAVSLQIPDRHGGQIHQAGGFILPAQLPPYREIIPPGPLQQRILKADAVDLRQESGMAAVIGPVGIQHADFRNRGIPFFPAEIIPAEGKVVRIHRQAVRGDHFFQARTVQLREARQNRDLRRNRIIRFQRGRLLQRCFPRLHRVNDILLNLRDLRLREAAGKHIQLRAAHRRTLALGNNLDTLGRRIRPLVKLAREILHRKNGGSGRIRFLRDEIQLGLRENRFHRVIKKIPGQVFHIITIQKAHLFQPPDAQKIPELAAKGPGFMIQTRALFHIHSVNHRIYFPP